MVIDLKLALFILFLLLAAFFWLGWTVARRRTLFDDKQLSVWQTFPLGFVLLTSSGNVRFANRQAFRMLHAEEGALSTNSFQHLLQKMERDTAVQHFPLTVTPEITLEAWVGPLGTYRLVLLRDVSEQRRREMDLHLYWSNVSHEVRTPLTSILSHLEVSRSENVPDEVQKHSLDIVYQQTQRLNNLIYSTLELGRLQATTQLDKISVDIVLVAEEAIAELILLAEAEAINLDFHFTPPIPPVLGNPDKLKQVFVNLIDNAIKYCEAGDAVTVALETAEDSVRCQVIDTGIGIPAEHLTQLTKQFYRVRRDVPGSGLGLAIVDEIVRQHNGRLTFTSTTAGDKQGTTVTFTLPILFKNSPQL